MSTVPNLKVYVTVKRSLTSEPFVEWRTGRRVVRAWVKPWSWPYFWREWGVIGFGALNIGVNILRCRTTPEAPHDDP